jgi:hypothetical protein
VNVHTYFSIAFSAALHAGGRPDANITAFYDRPMYTSRKRACAQNFRDPPGVLVPAVCRHVWA